MHNPGSMINVTAIWRGNKFVVEMDSDASLKDLGDELQKLTDVKPDTLRLIVPGFSGKGSKLLLPFSDDHSGLSLQEASVVEGKHIRMMGVSEDEVDRVLQNSKVDLRIAGFDEEEKRMRQRISAGSHALFKLPQGPYIFCDFRTLAIPGIELSPPASEALKRMHILASDPGIIAIMNKHHWRVGIMTEMAPVGYVGVSPKCILGFNKNHGEEISLRLRTDDLKGFRKYESIKKTLLHELAHMVYSEHDADFNALDKQLNQEANSLDWTKSRGHTLGGFSHLDDVDEDLHVTDNRSIGHKLGGNVSIQLASARVSSVSAAYRRRANASDSMSGASEIHEEPDPDDSSHRKQDEPYFTDVERESMNAEITDKVQLNKYEPDPDELQGKVVDEPIPDNVGHEQDHLVDDIESLVHNADLVSERMEEQVHLDKHHSKPDPDGSWENKVEPDPDESMADRVETNPEDSREDKVEPDPDDSREDKVEPDPDESIADRVEPDPDDSREDKVEPDPDDSREDRVEPDPDEYRASISLQANAIQADLLSFQGISSMQIDETNPDDQELQRIQDPVSFVCQRLQNAFGMLRSEVNSVEATAILQMLFKIIRNIIEHPNELKYKRLRKANPIIQRHVANCKAAMEIMQVVGFSEDVIVDETGKSETYLVLKRNDPGLLWLTKSTIEAYPVF